jgi:hypothetical protein
MKHVTDGTSNTYMVGEKFVEPNYYTGGNASSSDKDIGDDQPAWIGDDLDMHRLTGPTSFLSARPAPDQPLPRPIPPDKEYFRTFGSAHPSIFLMATCDASVHPVSYDIDPEVHHAYGTRNGGETPSTGL